MINFFKKKTNTYLTAKKSINSFLVKKKFVIYAKDINFLSIKELEASRRVLTRFFNRACHVIIPNRLKLSVTRKSLNMRMGKGRGKHYKFLHPITWGSKLLTCSANSKIKLYKALIKSSKKLSCKKKVYNIC